MSKIQWTGQTWNPVVGCSIKSPGCIRCYAMKEAYRFGFNPSLPHYAGLTEKSKTGPVWTGKLASAGANTWRKPLARRAPTTFFVNSMGDLFHEAMKLHWQVQAFAIMTLCQRHTFQVLTKRAEEMVAFIIDARDMVMDEAGRLATHEGIGVQPTAWPLKNVHLGVSVEDQRRADERIPFLRRTPAAIRFLSVEPQIEPIDLTDLLDGISWVIIGGESGRGARPFDIDWARSIIIQCRRASVHVFMKQLGSNPYSDGRPMHACPKGKYGDPDDWPKDIRIREMPEARPDEGT